MKIVVTNDQGFTEEQKQRLDSLGEVAYYAQLPQSGEEYLKRIEGADIICSGTAGLTDVYDQLKNVYLTVSFVSVAFADVDLMAKNGVKVSNAPGANRHAVSEWIAWMMLNIQRDFNSALNRQKTYRADGALPPISSGLAGRHITILGNGNIGKTVAKIASSFDARVSIFRRGDNLHDSVSDADIVVDTLSENPTTIKMLNADFFNSMKKGSSFITITRSVIVDDEAMIAALDSGHLNMVATDCGAALVGDTDDELYIRMREHPKILATPHISYSAEMSGKLGNDIMIDNVEAWIKGEPRNVVN